MISARPGSKLGARVGRQLVGRLGCAGEPQHVERIYRVLEPEIRSLHGGAELGEHFDRCLKHGGDLGCTVT